MKLGKISTVIGKPLAEKSLGLWPSLFCHFNVHPHKVEGKYFHHNWQLETWKYTYILNSPTLSLSWGANKVYTIFIQI